MKINFICFKFSKVTFSIIFIVLIITSIVIPLKILHKKEELQISSDLEEYNQQENTAIVENNIYNSINQIEVQAEKKSRIMPEEFKRFDIIGKIEIPKLKLEKYILKECTSKSLEVSVAKLSGPQINNIGNFCIAGHNYNRLFGKIKYLEKNDQIILTDVYGNRTIYQVYNNYKTSPKDISCLNQNTGNEKEITLITCTMGATKRVIVKAIEVYD